MKPPEERHSDVTRTGSDVTGNDVSGHSSQVTSSTDISWYPTSENHRPRACNVNVLHVQCSQRTSLQNIYRSTGSEQTTTSSLLPVSPDEFSITTASTRDTDRLRHHSHDDDVRSEVFSDVIMTSSVNAETLETSPSTQINHNERLLVDIATQHNDHTTTTTTATTTGTTTTGSGDLDVFNVESTLPDMNWDRLEEQLRNALQLERRAEVGYKIYS